MSGRTRRRIDGLASTIGIPPSRSIPIPITKTMTITMTMTLPIARLLLIVLPMLGTTTVLAETPADATVDAQRSWVAEFSGAGQADAGVRSSPEQRAEAAAWLASHLEALNLAARRHDYRLPNVNGLVDLLMPPLQGVNVYAVVEATVPDAPVVVIGAHYDSEPGSPGAGDNAAGVALVLTLARWLQEPEHRTRDVYLVFFDQEEDDEVGSRAFARHLHREGLEVDSVHVTDLSGWDDDGDGVVEIQSPPPRLEARYRRAADRLGIPLRVTTGGSSDNKSFLAAGLPTVGVFGDVTRHLHRPTDTLETVDFEYLRRMTLLIHEAVSQLPAPATREGAPSTHRQEARE